MRIVVNDVAASEGGALTLLEGFHRHLLERGDGNDWFLLTGCDLFEDSPRVHPILLADVKRSWLKRLAFDFLGGRRLVSRLRADVVLSLQNTLIWGAGCPQALYVHQALPFQRVKNYSFFRRQDRLLATYQHLIGRLIKMSARKADRVIVQSEWMRAALIGDVGVPEDHVVVIPPDLEDLSEYARPGEFDRARFLYPTGEFPYKNVECVEEACRLLSAEGHREFTVTLTVETSETPNVEAVGRLPRPEVLTRLAASTLVFPSFVETFGLPLLEARALGCVVLAADLPYAREVLHGYANAYYFNPEHPDELATLMKRVMLGEIVRREPAPALPSASDGWERMIDLVTELASHNASWPGRASS